MGAVYAEALETAGLRLDSPYLIQLHEEAWALKERLQAILTELKLPMFRHETQESLRKICHGIAVLELILESRSDVERLT